MMPSLVPQNVWGAAKAFGACKKLIASAVDNTNAPRKCLFVWIVIYFPNFAAVIFTTNLGSVA